MEFGSFLMRSFLWDSICPVLNLECARYLTSNDKNNKKIVINDIVILLLLIPSWLHFRSWLHCVSCCMNTEKKKTSLQRSAFNLI